VSLKLKTKYKIVVRVLLACVLIIIGLMGMVLPVLQGIPFLIAGLIVLSTDFPYIERKIESLVKKNANIEKMYKKIHSIIKKYI
jgi:uncharacterized membrane protein YbaN (DUF454 family)